MVVLDFTCPRYRYLKDPLQLVPKHWSYCVSDGFLRVDNSATTLDSVYFSLCMYVLM